MNSFISAGSKTIVAGLALCISIVFVNQASAAEYVSVMKDGVNVRSGPSTDDEVRWEVFKSFPLEILKRDGKWAHCGDFEGDKGWIHSDLLASEKTVIVKKKKVNLRNEPNTEPNTRIIAIVKYGVVFIPLTKQGDWLKVRHADNTEGWVHKDLVWPSDPLD